MSSLKVATSKDENWWSRCWKVVKGDDEGVCESDCEGGCDKQTDKLTDGHTDIGNCRVTFVINNIFNAITSPIPPKPHNQKHNMLHWLHFFSRLWWIRSDSRCDDHVLISLSINHPYCIDAGWDCCCHEPISFIHTTTTITFISVILNTVQWQCST